MTASYQPYALALSGGGVRAMAFHAGVLKYLAEHGKLESISCLSTVSGGSLLIGLVFAKSDMKWPNSTTYLQRTLPEIRRLLTSVDLQHGLIKRLFFPKNWRYFLSRANIVAHAISEDWQVQAKLGDLPSFPVWSINGTTAENGKRFRFKKIDFGDYELGYAPSDEFPLASAMAVSAAFPVGIGPLAITTSEHRWEKRPEWEAPESSKKAVQLPYKRLHVYDGGVYDNLGLESFYDIGKQKPKGEYRIIVSDAGAPLRRGFDLSPISPFRLKRLIDIVTEQNRSLRIRAFIDYLSKGNSGAFLGIGSSPRQLIKKLDKDSNVVKNRDWLDDEKIEIAKCYPTNLGALSLEMFDLIARHGYEVASVNDEIYAYLS